MGRTQSIITEKRKGVPPMMTKQSQSLKRLITLAKKHKIIEISIGEIKLVFHPMAFMEPITSKDLRGFDLPKTEEERKRLEDKEYEDILFHSVGGAN